MSARPRSIRARAAAVALGAVVLLGACTHRETVPDNYGDTTRRNFTEGCEEALTDSDGEGEALDADVASDTCECIYEGIVDGQDGVDKVPFEDFKEYNSDLSDDPGPLPESIQAHVDACRATAALRG